MIDDGGESKSIELRSGGRVSLRLDVVFFALSKEDRDFVFSLIDTFKDYGRPQPAPVDITTPRSL